MRLPRDMPAKRLIKFLESKGYKETRQVGSHIRLTRMVAKQHHITVPNHNPVRVGTLSAILLSVANHLEVEKSSIVRELLG